MSGTYFHEGGVERVRTGLLSIPTVLSLTELLAVSRFVHTLVGRVLGVFLVDPALHDERELRTIAQFCDTRIDVREGPELRSQGFLDGEAEWVPFDPLPADAESVGGWPPRDVIRKQLVPRLTSAVMADSVSEGIRVLYADDDADAAESTAAGLEREPKLAVETVPDARAGLARLDAGGIDCVVSGTQLPDRTGVEFLRAVRDRSPNLPFVLYTGTGSEAVASAAISADVTDYLRTDAHADARAVLADRVRTAVERYRTDHERHRRDRLFEAVFEDPKMLVGVLSPAGRLRVANRTAMEFVDADHEDLVGRPFWETPWWAEEIRDEVQGWVERAADGEYVEYEADHVRTGTDRRSVSGTVRPVTDESGTVVSLIASARDITERRDQERELRRRNESLDQFTSVVSHDLRNPLNVATGHLSVAQRETKSAHLDETAHALDRMGDLIEDLLCLARAGDRVSDFETVDLAETVRECWRNVSATETSLTVETTESIRADRSQLQNLLENLFRNSVEHGSTDSRPESGGAVEYGSPTPHSHARGDGAAHDSTDGPTTPDGVSITVGDCEGGFYVADDGPGIPEADREAVFESGYSTSNDGTGFGLSIVAEIADAHGWAVDVTESAADGSRFEITGVTSATEPPSAD
jgi:PAS domain S-box-containing protein